jgi:hypothetical protein
MFVTKSSGKKTKFDRKRIIKTCMRSGLTMEDSENVVSSVENQIYDGIDTRKLLKIIISEIRKHDKHAASRYDLKGSIMRLGPAGFVFEKFISRILQAEGYKTKTNQIIQGSCVTHEIDVVAEKQEISMIECKYHNSPGIYTGVKDVLYTYARFLDLKEGYSEGKCENFSNVWLASNTKFSRDVLTYATKKNIILLGWSYPIKNSLQELIEKHKLYPITILRSVNQEAMKNLLDHNIVTVKDIIDKKPNIPNISKILKESIDLTGK